MCQFAKQAHSVWMPERVGRTLKTGKYAEVKKTPRRKSDGEYYIQAQEAENVIRAAGEEASTLERLFSRTGKSGGISQITYF